MCQGGAYCCVYDSGVCLLCLLCSFSWEEDVYQYVVMGLYTPLVTQSSTFHLLYAHFTDFMWVGGKCNEIYYCCFLIQGFGFMCL